MKSKLSFNLICLGLSLASASGSSAFAGEGGTNTGHTARANAAFRSWCRSANAALDNALIDADLQLLSGHLVEAKKLLVHGLAQALAKTKSLVDPIDQAQSLTYRVLTRGLEIATAMGDVDASNPRDLNKQIQVLKSYYRFILDTSRELDIPGFIPMHMSYIDHTPKPALDQSVFEKRYQRFAADQIKWLIDSFIVNCANGLSGDYNQVCINGSDAIFFRVASLVMSYAAQDLNDSLFQLQFACVQEEILNMQDRLDRYNTGDESALGDDVRVGLNAIVYPHLQSFMSQIQNGCGK